MHSYVSQSGIWRVVFETIKQELERRALRLNSWTHFLRGHVFGQNESGCKVVIGLGGDWGLG